MFYNTFRLYFTKDREGKDYEIGPKHVIWALGEGFFFMFFSILRFYPIRYAIDNAQIQPDATHLNKWQWWNKQMRGKVVMRPNHHRP